MCISVENTCERNTIVADEGGNQMTRQLSVGIIGCGAVGQVIAQKLGVSPLVSDLVLADIRLSVVEAVAKRMRCEKASASRVDARNPQEVAGLAKAVDLVVNCTPPALNLKIMEGCLKGGAFYIDMATGYPSYGHQFILDKKWEDASLLALLSIGIDPGASDLFAKRAADRMESVDYVKVRDADTGRADGYEFAAYFCPEAMMEEILGDPPFYENGELRSSPALEVSEVYRFPDPIGPVKVYRTDHEESELIPMFIGKRVGFVDFMITLDESFVNDVRVLKRLGLLSAEPMDVKGVKVSPLDVVVSVMPKPEDLAGKIKGHSCVLTEVGGRMDGENVVIKTWTCISHERAIELCGIHATAYQTAMPVVVAIEMIARGEIRSVGVKPPEIINPVMFCDYLQEKDIPVCEEILRTE